MSHQHYFDFFFFLRIVIKKNSFPLIVNHIVIMIFDQMIYYFATFCSPCMHEKIEIKHYTTHTAPSTRVLFK